MSTAEGRAAAALGRLPGRPPGQPGKHAAEQEQHKPGSAAKHEPVGLDPGLRIVGPHLDRLGARGDRAIARRPTGPTLPAIATPPGPARADRGFPAGRAERAQDVARRQPIWLSICASPWATRTSMATAIRAAEQGERDSLRLDGLLRLTLGDG